MSVPDFLRLALGPVPRLAARTLVYLLLAAAPCAQAADTAALNPDSMAARLAACTFCHGKQGRAGPDGYYPRLAGKPQAYLYHQLLNFRENRRRYPPMQHLLENLPDAYLYEIAGYFASQQVPYPPPERQNEAPSVLEAGRTLALHGDTRRNLPACIACHGASLGGVAPAIPGLLGLPGDYIVSQLGGWKNSLRHATPPDCMADIANKLTSADIRALSAWLAAQPIAEPYGPEPAGSIKLPVECGSQAQR
jgi:cytochrome c553